MDTDHPDAISEARKILAQAATLARATHSAFPDEEEARRMLNAHGIPDAEIERQMSTLRANTADSTAVLTSYSLLHSLQHLDAIDERSLRLPFSGEATVAVFRCAEICLHNMGVLSSRMRANLEAGRLDLAVSNARWRSGFHEVLYRLSSLVVEVGVDDARRPFLDIRNSRVFAGHRHESVELQQGLMTRWSEHGSDIFERDLDDPLRYITFSEFANTSDERIWLSRLSRVRVAGAEPDPGDDDSAFYERTICSEEIVAMLTALETEADTDLLPFRAVHQVAEIIAGVVNRHLCSVVEKLVSEPDLSPAALRILTASNRLLAVVDDVTKLLMRALTPRAYSEIRSNLGMVRGTSSLVLRKTLFNSTYPLLVRAFRLRISAFDVALAGDNDAVRARAIAILGDPDRDVDRSAEIMQQLIVLHQHIRTWRDNHQQFPKTHLGASPVEGRPTVSLSGSDSAVDIAHRLRKTHASDPIAPFYEAVLGTAPPEVHELLTPGGFDEYMAHKTARAVFDVYEEVQARFHERVGGRRAPDLP